MREFYDLAEFATFMDEVAMRSESVLGEAIGLVALLIKDRAQSYFGKPGELPPPLAPSTVMAREHGWGHYRATPTQGAGPNSTLLWTGALRDSIETDRIGLIAGVGSPSPVARYQELGTAKIPPRPFLTKAAYETQETGIQIVTSMVGRGMGIDVSMPAGYLTSKEDA